MINNDNYGKIQLNELEVQTAQATYMSKVYGWMLGALSLTASMAYIVFSTSSFLEIIAMNMWMFWAVLIAEFGLVIYLSSRINQMSASKATGAFIVYALLNGITFALILASYSMGAIVSTFAITAGMFGALSLFGFVTKKDLSGMQSFLFMGLVGLFLIFIVNIFIGSGLLYFLFNLIGVIVFAGLTAYDTQKIKKNYAIQAHGNEIATKGAIMGALILYLDFINLFLFLLRFIGGRD